MSEIKYSWKWFALGVAVGVPAQVYMPLVKNYPLYLGTTVTLLAFAINFLAFRGSIRLLPRGPATFALFGYVLVWLFSSVFASIFVNFGPSGRFQQLFGTVRFLRDISFVLIGATWLQGSRARSSFVKGVFWATFVTNIFILLFLIGHGLTWSTLGLIGRSDFRSLPREWLPSWPNVYANFLVVVALLYTAPWERGRKVWRIATLLIVLVVIGVSRSRSSWLGLLGGVLAYVVTSLWLNKRRITALLVTIVIMILGVILCPYVLDLVSNDVSMIGRVDRWIAAVEAISRSPILGYGQASIAEVAPNFYWRITGGYELSVSAHSDYVDIMLRSGLLGLLAFLVFVVSIPIQIIQSSWSQTRVWSATMVGVLASMLVMGLVQQPFRHEQLLALVWMLSGSLIAGEEFVWVGDVSQRVSRFQESGTSSPAGITGRFLNWVLVKRRRGLRKAMRALRLHNGPRC